MFKLSSFLLVLSLVTVSIVVARPSYDDGLEITHYRCCIKWKPWAWAKADDDDEGWYSVWAEAEGTRERYSGSYDGPLDVSVNVTVYTTPDESPPSNYHSSYCN